MFRENVLTQDTIINRIASTMVPVVFDYQKLQDRTSKEAQFLLPLVKQRNQDQGVWIFSPEGKALSGFVGFGDMAGQTKKIIEDALSAFGRVKPRAAKAVATHPWQGKGVMPDGSVWLAEYIRTSDNALQFMNAKSPVVSSVALSAKEFRAFAPQETVVGATWVLPDEVAKKLCRITSPMCYQHAPQPDWVTGVRVHARVRTIKDGVARVIYEGRISSEHRAGSQLVSDQEMKLTGEGVYDLKTGKVQSVLLVGAGTLRWPEAPEKIVTFEALVEWAVEAANQ